MKIEFVKEDYLREIRFIDNVAFSRSEPRRISNLKTLNQSAPEGSFVALEDGKVVGFVFTKVFGREGYIGPIGIHPDYQEKGYGKTLLEASIEYLKGCCSVIGLEVNPSILKNIYIYNKLGFITAFPTVIFNSRVTNSSSTYDHLNFHPLHKDRKLSSTLEKLDLLLNSQFNGIDYRGELENSLNHNGTVVLCFNKGLPAGFINYCPTTHPFAWGFIKECAEQSTILPSLLNLINISYGSSVPIAINGRFTEGMKLLSSYDFPVRLSMNRMLLKGYEGDYFNTTRKLHMRAWMN